MNDFDSLFDGLDNDSEYLTEVAKLKFTEDLVRFMKTKNISRSDLANKISRSPAFITKLLRGSNNFTLSTMVHVANALGVELSLSLKEKAANYEVVEKSRRDEQNKGMI